VRGHGSRELPPAWALGTLGAIFALQVAVTLARPVSTYRLLALDASGAALGLAAASFALPPIFLGVLLGRWTERHHPGLMLSGGLAVTSLSTLVLLSSRQVLVIAGATMLLGIGHMAGAIGGQSIMARAQSGVPRLTRFGVFTTASALGQVAGPILGGFIVGSSGEPTVGTTSEALWVATVLVTVGLVPALVALRTTMRPSTQRVGRAAPVWALLRIRGMGAALATSFSAKGASDLLLVYMPVLGLAIGLSSQEVGVLLGISSAGALVARASTPFFARRVPEVRLTNRATVVAALCVLGLTSTDRLTVLVPLSVILGFALGLTQTTTMAWVVGLVEDTSRGSALGLRLATNRLGQAVVVAAAGLVAGWWGVSSAFLLLGAAMLVAAVAGARSDRPESGDQSGGG
jgi:MFS family permease